MNFSEWLNTTPISSGNLSREDVLGEIRYESELQIILSGIGFFINVATLIMLRKSDRKVNSHSLIVSNQCVTDSLICLFTFIERCLKLTDGSLINDPIMCIMMIAGIIRLSAYIVTLLNMILMTSSRFFAVAKPTTYKIVFSQNMTFKIIVCMYISVIVLVMSTIIKASVMYMKRPIYFFCFMFFASGGMNIIDIALIVLFMSLLMMIPVVYGYITTIIMKNNRIVNAQRTSRKRKSSNIIVTSFMIVFTFVICFTPYTILRLVMRFLSHGMSESKSSKLLTLTCYFGIFPVVNCICDPIIYSLRIPKLRSGYSMLRRNMRCTSNTDHTTIDFE